MSRFTVLLLAALLTTPLAAQEPRAIDIGRAHTDSLSAADVHTFAIDLDADRFVLGEADQETVDVVVTVYGPDGELTLTADGPARGPERFHFETERAGRYRIEVKPLEGASGRYTLLLRRVEPVATEPEPRVDQLMAAYDGSEPGGVVGVVRNGRLVFSKAYGMANLTHGIPFTTETLTNIGSTSKQFTAFAVNLLAERGELSLDDDIREHIPELKDFGETVTLRHLMTHTSGYREFLNTLVLSGRRLDQGDHIERGELIDIVRRQPELQNPPGAEWNYNNTAFALLPMVVERVTGQPFPEWMERNVFEPLGMEHTVVRADPLRIVPNSAQGYSPDEDGGWREAKDLGGAMGAGGIYTTVGDLARWIRNFETGEVGGAALFDRMTTRYVLTDGDTTSYGFGLGIDEWRGLRRIHHGGADVAHRSMLRYFPAIDAGVLTLSNNATFNSNAMSDDVAEAFFGAELEPEAGSVADADDGFDPDSYDPEDFDDLAGRYALEEMPAFVMRFWRDDDDLFTQATGQRRLPLRPTSDSTFALTGVEASVTFHHTADGEVESLTLHQNGHHLARRVEAWEPTPAELADYTGRYFSRELATFYTIEVEDDELVLRHRRFSDGIELEPGQEPDSFSGGGVPIGEANFERDEAGEVTALVVSNVRTRGVRFEKIADGMPW